MPLTPDIVRRYREAGWTPIPLTPTAENPKGIPPRGVTGYHGRYYGDLELYALNWAGKNVAIRLPGDVVGVDVDAYHDGMQGLAELEEAFGPLPATVMAHNHRCDGSGIRLFRVPMGTTLRTDPAQGVDMIQYFHRYVVCAPTIHPDGRAYGWWDQADDEPVDWPPEPGDLPELPWRWTEGLAMVKGGRADRPATSDEVTQFIDAHTAADKPAALKSLQAALTEATSRHDTAVRVACWGFREAAAGWYPASDVVDALRDWWRERLAAEPRRRDGGELDAIMAWAIAEVCADPERVAEKASPAGRKTGRTKAPSARDALVQLAAERYRLGRADDERVYLVPVDGPNVALFSGHAKAELARCYYRTTGDTVGRSPIDEAWITVEGLAADVPKETLPIRVAMHDGVAVVDLGTTDGAAVVITPGGWSVVDRSPVTFRRSKAMLPLPSPARGGGIAPLFELLNVGVQHRDLFTGWLVASLFADLPHPIAVLRGEQGAAKSTTARCMVQLVDPCLATTQKPPKAEEDWAQSCVSRWAIAIDNVSTVPDWWSDALCRTVTGDGWLRRQLFTDDEVVASAYRRVVILNGITVSAGMRSDLAERLVTFGLERPASWLTEAEVQAELDRIRPGVLGALLDMASRTLLALPLVDIPRDLRMADFARLLAAFDAATSSAALDAYRQQVADAFADALDADPLATAVVGMMAEHEEWVGSATDLLKLLGRYSVGDESVLPRTSSILVTQMTRSSPVLRRVGIEWSVLPRTNRSRAVRLARVRDAGDAVTHFPPLLHMGTGGVDGRE